MSSVNGPSRPFKLVSANSTNATPVSGNPGFAKLVQAVNNGAAWAYLKVYDENTSPTVGTDTSVLCFGIPPGGGTIESDVFWVKNGLAFAITANPADSDTTAVAAAQVVVNFLT
jgi:hypothetical protein